MHMTSATDLSCSVCIYKLHLESSWGCIMAVSSGSDMREYGADAAPAQREWTCRQSLWLLSFLPASLLAPCLPWVQPTVSEVRHSGFPTSPSMFSGTPATLSQQPPTLALFSDQLGHPAAVVDIWLPLEDMTSPKTFPLSLEEGAEFP